MSANPLREDLEPRQRPLAQQLHDEVQLRAGDLRAARLVDVDVYTGLLVVLAVPAVIGMFWGAPLISRELETGTHYLAWNQGVTRTR